MLRELVEAAARFRAEGNLLPTAYKAKVPRWIVHLRGGQAYLEGPYGRQDVAAVPAPDRQRSGTPSENNLKPYLLVDDARYALGKANPRRREDVALLHRGFVELLAEASRETNLQALHEILAFLHSSQVEAIRNRVDADGLVVFRVDGVDPAAEPVVQDFWARYLARELELPDPGTCAVCGQHGPVLRILPREVVVLGQKCQVVSFNRTAFRSFGKEQTANSPLCFACASSAIDVLDYLIRTERHRKVLVQNPKTREMANQLAVFWLREELQGQLDGVTYQIEEVLGSLLGGGAADAEDSGPPADLSQLRALLSVPWTAQRAALNLAANRFYLAVLSANKGRLVVREWLDVAVDRVRDSLKAFLDGVSMVNPAGTAVYPQTVETLVAALSSEDPNLSRCLLRTAFLGYPPPNGLMATAVGRFRIAAADQDMALLHRLAALLKLTLLFGKPEEEVKRMAALDPGRKERAYQCGRLFAVLEEAQRRAAGTRLNITIAERFYGATAAAPAPNLTILLNRAHTSHLPQIRRKQRGHGTIEQLLGEVLSRIHELGGLPQVHSLPEQAEFAIGFYHQRVQFRQRPQKAQEEGVAS